MEKAAVQNGVLFNGIGRHGIKLRIDCSLENIQQ